jgi:hypothetical protein
MSPGFSANLDDPSGFAEVAAIDKSCATFKSRKVGFR